MAAKHEQLTITIVGKQMGLKLVYLLYLFQMSKFCSVDWSFSGFWNKQIDILNPVCVKYWISPNSQSNLFAGEVSGGENYSNLFYTPQATYLPLLFLRQPISKLDTRALSLSPWLLEQLRSSFQKSNLFAIWPITWESLKFWSWDSKQRTSLCSLPMQTRGWPIDD